MTHEWQPIETVPKDGTVFLATRIHNEGAMWPRLMKYGVTSGPDDNYTWNRGSPWFVSADGRHLAPHPSHWMPLPPPPKEEMTDAPEQLFTKTEADALVAAAYEDAADCISVRSESPYWPKQIRARTPADADEALDCMIHAAVAAERERCASLVADVSLFGNWSVDCRARDEIAAAIRDAGK